MAVKKNKKTALYISGTSLVLGAIIFFLWLFGLVGKRGGGKENYPLLPTPTLGETSLSHQDEPQVELKIKADRSGAVLVISEIKPRFTKVEYELIYLAEGDEGKIERGVAGGPLVIPSTRKIEEEILFGSQSCTSGICRRHIDKNVSSGTITIRLADKEDKSWSFQKGFVIEKIKGKWEAVWGE